MARKVSLREFQQDLTRRLTEAAATSTHAARLGVQSGDHLWLVRLDEAGEVIPPPALATVPLTHEWFRGLVNIRGNLYSVIDLARFGGGEPTREGADARLLLVAERYQMSTALLVSRMLGLKSLEALTSEPRQPEDPAWCAGRYTDNEGRLWRELAVGDLVYHHDFLEAGVQA
jgi:twitching motility protein PilI